MSILRNQGNWIRKRKHAGSQPPVLNAFLRSVCVALLLLPIIPVFGADVLLVDDDDNVPDVRSVYTDVLTALGVSYEIWDTNNSDNEPDATKLSQYHTVIWFSGDEYGGYAGPGSTGEAALAEYLDNSGCLFISSQDYYYDRDLTSFMTDYLGVSTVQNDVAQTTATGTGLFSGLGPYTLDYPAAGLNNYSDDITYNSSIANRMLAGSTGSAAIYRNAGSYRTAYLGFSFAAIPSASEREEAMRAMLAYCKPHVLLVDDDDNSPDVRSYYATALDDLGVDYLVWDTLNSDNEPTSLDMWLFPVVTWFTGDAFNSTAGPSAGSEGQLNFYLGSLGGRLFLSSQDYLYRRSNDPDGGTLPGSSAFMSDKLDLTSYVQDQGHTQVIGAGPYTGLGYDLVYPFTDYSDKLSFGAGAGAGGSFIGESLISPNPLEYIGTYKSHTVGATTYKTIFWAFPFEAIPTPGERYTAMWQTLTYLSPEDTDGDGTPDWLDYCPWISSTLADNDSDGRGDACDLDDDNDGVPDAEDALPFDPSESVDTDHDGIGNNADTDDDNDTIPDILDQPPGRNPLVADWMVSAAGAHNCALDDDGVTCWGNTGSGATTVPALTNPVMVSANGDHACALDDTGVRCWGLNNYGQAPPGVPVPGLANPVAVSAGSSHTCALDGNSVKCWGRNDAGQAGPVPGDPIPGLTNPVAISSGGYHTCALDSGNVKCWGDNVYGQAPATVPGLTNPVAISAGYLHTCALDATGVVCWGAGTDPDDYGTSPHFNQSIVPGLSHPYAIGAGYYHTCAIDDNGMHCWGLDNQGQVSAIPALTNPVAVDGGYYHTCALDNDGVHCWGWNAYGQITVPALAFDKDGDGVDDASDAFPLDPNEQYDTDGDGVGNNADTDDDNDGIPDSFELAHPGVLDPLNAADANQDFDGDFASNLYEYQAGTDLENGQSQPPGKSYRFERAWPGLQQPWYFIPEGLAVDSDGFVFIADPANHRIRKFNADGFFVAEWGAMGNADGQFTFPFDVAVDNQGFVYVADTGNNRIQKFTDNGEHKGSFPGPFAYGPNHIAYGPKFSAVDGEGYLYVVDETGNQVYRFTDNGVFVNSWNGTENGGTQFNWPKGIVADAAGFVYVADSDGLKVRKFSSAGVEQSLAGTDLGNTTFISPMDLTIDANGLLHVLDVGYWSAAPNQVYVFTTDGQAAVPASWGSATGDGALVLPTAIASGPNRPGIYVADRLREGVLKFRNDGEFTAAWQGTGGSVGMFAHPHGVAIDSAGTLYVADDTNARVQYFPATGQPGEWTSWNDGMVHPFGSVADVAVDNAGDVYILDGGNNRVIKLHADGTYVTDWQDSFNQPLGLAVSGSGASGKVYVADSRNNRIMQYNSDGTSARSWDGSAGGGGQLDYPQDVAVDENNGYVYVADFGNGQIQKFTADGVFILYWPLGYQNALPTGVAVDSSGFVYVSDYSGFITKYTGNGQAIGMIGAPGSKFGQLTIPAGMAIDTSGPVDKIYVADTFNARIQVFQGLESYENVRAIILNGGGISADNNLRGASAAMADYAYNALLAQGFLTSEIQYLTDDNNASGQTGDASLGDLTQAITNLVTADPPIDAAVIYAVDHGGNDNTTSEGTFLVRPGETLSASGLNTMLNGLGDIPVTVIIDACQSEGFVSPLAGSKRTIIASSAVGEASYFTGDGAMSFSSAFWGQVMNGSNLQVAQQFAEDMMAVTRNMQTPQLDAWEPPPGGTGSSDGNPNQGDDYTAAAAMTIGAGTALSSGAPFISGVSVVGAQPLNGTSSAGIHINSVADSDGVNAVWAIVTPPHYTSTSFNNPVTKLQRFELVGDENSPGVYQGEYDGFTQSGLYKVNVFAKDRLGYTSRPETIDVVVGSASRKAILVLGGEESDTGWADRKVAADALYAALLAQGYGPDDIEYETGANNLTGGMDRTASLSNLSFYLGEATHDLLLYLVGESDGNGFRLNPDFPGSETLTTTQLDAWLANLLPLPGKLTVVMDADNAGIYLVELDASEANGGSDFYRIASTVSGTARFDGGGSVSYTRYFAGAFANGATTAVAHLDAKRIMAALTSQQQLAWIDTNSDDISENSDISRILYTDSLGTDIVHAGDAPVIGSAGVEGFNAAADPMAVTLWADDITTTGSINEVWALVTPPDVDGFGGIDPVPVKVPLTDNGTRYEPEAPYNPYSLSAPLGGTYTVTFYADDTDGAVSLPWIETLTREDDFEADDVDTQASDITIDDPAGPQYHSFHDVRDDDGDPADVDWVKFTAGVEALTVKANPLGAGADIKLTVIYPAGSNPASVEVNDVPAGEYPLGTEWHIIPANNPGEFKVKVELDTTVNNVPSDYTLAVTTDGGGTVTTEVKGQITDTSGNGVESAQVKATGTGTTTGTSTDYSATNGDYSIDEGAGTYAMTAQKCGYVNGNGGEVTIPANGVAIRNIVMTPVVHDCDGDTINSDTDNCPYTYNYLQANYDGDAQGDDCDSDNDNDGIPNEIDALPWDTDNDGLDNTVDDDDDGDGFTDAEEIAAGTDPLDPTDYPSTAIPGDINGDGIVNVVDLLLCTRIVLGLASSANEDACDVAPLDAQGNPQGDDLLNAGDIGVLQRMVLGL